MKDLSHLTLNQVDAGYRDGSFDETSVIEYLKLWNAGPHFIQAVLRDGAIRQFDPEKSGVFYRHLQAQFGLRLS